MRTCSFIKASCLGWDGFIFRSNVQYGEIKCLSRNPEQDCKSSSFFKQDIQNSLTPICNTNSLQLSIRSTMATPLRLCCLALFMFLALATISGTAAAAVDQQDRLKGKSVVVILIYFNPTPTGSRHGGRSTLGMHIAFLSQNL